MDLCRLYKILIWDSSDVEYFKLCHFFRFKIYWLFSLTAPKTMPVALAAISHAQLIFYTFLALCFQFGAKLTMVNSKTKYKNSTCSMRNNIKIWRKSFYFSFGMQLFKNFVNFALPQFLRFIQNRGNLPTLNRHCI